MRDTVDGMDWDQLEEFIRAQMKAQPRGYQVALAERLGIAQPSVAQFVSGRRSIPTAHVATILDELGFKLAVVPK
ncbi:YdaS family helix-turn-helix protein [Deinococcus sp. Leaf326]|uniref:YdaS family helix-turn-helix protein n=1 Tax=Deinococcus sp. Leaf326 TaxID=1736338 RepID=UPI0006FAE6D6|nr:YdaS family helix-turn-helix protein [Deinococcus sp. Leaf326]KQR40720.1 hypothetical protein ASF71_00705 [Deinococcus sp. Leaf326]